MKNLEEMFLNTTYVVVYAVYVANHSFNCHQIINLELIV